MTAAVVEDQVTVEIERDFHGDFRIEVSRLGGGESLTAREEDIITAVEGALDAERYHAPGDDCEDEVSANYGDWHHQDSCKTPGLITEVEDLTRSNDALLAVLEQFHRRYHDQQFPAEFCDDSMCREAREL